MEPKVLYSRVEIVIKTRPSIDDDDDENVTTTMVAATSCPSSFFPAMRSQEARDVAVPACTRKKRHDEKSNGTKRKNQEQAPFLPSSFLAL